MILVISIQSITASAPIKACDLALKTVQESSFVSPGTGTEGATLRVYLESFEPDTSKHHLGCPRSAGRTHQDC
jgi:glutamine synthetase